MSKVPQARERIRNLHKLLEVVVLDLREIETMLHRKKAVRKAAPRSKKMTPELANRIRQFAQRNSDASLQDIATRFSVNSGRVSEVLHGKR